MTEKTKKIEKNQMMEDHEEMPLPYADDFVFSKEEDDDKKRLYEALRPGEKKDVFENTDPDPAYGGEQQVVRIEEILDKLNKYNPDADIPLVQAAYIFAANAHRGMVRRSGEPYLNHPLAVAAILCDMHMDVPSIVAGLLHDTIEDTDTTEEDIIALFGDEVAAIVDGVTKISRMNFNSASEQKASSMRKMILAMLTDLRVILVKLADRLNNIRTLGFMPEHKQKRIAEETLDIFAPLASRLGIHKIQAELEDLCLFFLEPTAYEEIRRGLAAGRSDRDQYVEEVIKLLSDRIRDFGINAQVEGRSKHIYSIWKKMMDQNLPFEQIYDLIAFRIIVPNIQDCYSALGVMHSIFKPIPGRLKDYIHLPKSNGYQSLHTAVIGPRSMRMEVQIRTKEMHSYAEHGVAAHWRYKEGGVSNETENKRTTALRSILSWQENLANNPEAYMSSVRDSLAEQEKSIYTFTPQGDVKELLHGSCPVDFAYAVHTMVGHNCVGAKVNGAIVPLRHKLSNGDTVDIITSRNGIPSRDWLNFVASPKAKARIRQWFATEEREKAVSFGREILEKEMRKAGLPKAKLHNLDLLKEFGFNNLDELNAAVAFGKVPLKKLWARMAPEKEAPIATPSSATKNDKAESHPKADLDLSKNILVSGQDDIFVRLAKCCTPIPGEAIIGYITQGHGITIHSDRCPSLAGLDHERFVSVTWDENVESYHEVYIRVHAENQPGSLLQVVNALNGNVANILEAHADSTDISRGTMWFKILLKNQDQYKSVVSSLKRLEAVKKVERFYPQGVEVI